MCECSMLFNCMSWIFEHCETIEDYADALTRCDFTNEQILVELVDNCGFSTEEASNIVNA